MSLRSSIYYGRFGHIFYDGYDCCYYWTPKGSHSPLIWIPRFLARWLL